MREQQDDNANVLAELKARIDKDEYAAVALHKQEHERTIAETRTLSDQIAVFLKCAEGKTRAQFDNVITNNFIDTEVTLE